MESMDYDRSDSPIESYKHDLLSRSEYCSKLAKAVINWPYQKGLVVGLRGKWGDGKTSALNLVKEQLNENPNGDESPEIFEFNPWQWKDQEELNSIFFREISGFLGMNSNRSNNKELSKLFKRYSLAIDTSHHALKGLTYISAPFIALFPALVVSGIDLSSNKIGIAAATIAAFFASLLIILNWGATLFEKLSSFYSNFSDEETISSLRYKIGEILRERDQKLVVIVDDMDRLAPNQLHQMAKLVNTNSKFPNMAFLLAYDRRITESKLEEEYYSGSDYLEKIVQIHYDLPSIDDTAIERSFFSRIDDIFNRSQLELSDDEKNQIYYVFSTVGYYFFGNLRDIKIFSSSFEFTLSHFIDSGECEVDIVDLIVLECFRLFEPKIYNKFSSMKNALTNISLRESEASKKDLQELLSIKPNNPRIKLDEIVVSLFPRTRNEINPRKFGWTQTLKDYNVGDASGFDRYFQLRLSDKELSNSIVTSLISEINENNNICEQIISHYNNGTIDDLLSRLSRRLSDIQDTAVQTFLLSLAESADRFPRNRTVYGWNYDTYLSSIAVDRLRRYQNTNEKCDILENLVLHSKGYSLVLHLFDEYEKHQSQSALGISNAEFTRLRDQFINIISGKALKHPEEIITNTHLGKVLHFLKNNGQLQLARNLVKDANVDSKYTLSIVKAFVIRSSSLGSNSSTTYEFEVDRINEIIDPDLLRTALNKVDVEKLELEDQRIADAFLDAIDRQNS